MLIRKELKPGQKPTPEQIARIREAAKRPIVYDAGQWKIFCVWKWQKSAKTLRKTRKNIRKSAQEKTLCHI